MLVREEREIASKKGEEESFYHCVKVKLEIRLRYAIGSIFLVRQSN